jgi:hypothetical protein
MTAWHQGRGGPPKGDREAARLFQLRPTREAHPLNSILGSSTKGAVAANRRTIMRPHASISSPRIRDTPLHRRSCKTGAATAGGVEQPLGIRHD